MNVVPVTIRALAPTERYVRVFDLARSGAARSGGGSRSPHEAFRTQKGDPGEFGGCRGPQQAIADGGNRSPSSLKQQAETESSSSAISAPRAVLRQICGNSTYPAPSLGEISRTAAGITLAAKDQAARPNRQGLGARKCY